MALSLPPAPLLSLLLAVGATAQKLRLGPCPDIEPVSDFNTTAYSGLWYENRRLQNIRQVAFNCVTTRLSDDLGGFMSAEYNGYLLATPVRAYSYLAYVDGSNTGSFSATYPESDNLINANYNVIEVDYDKYAVVYACANQLGGTSHKELLWLFTRKARFSGEEAHQIIRNLMNRGISQAYEMKRTEQFLCPGRDITPDL